MTYTIWRHPKKDILFSCNLRCWLIFLHGRSRTYRVASLRAGPVARISYNLYFDCNMCCMSLVILINEYYVVVNPIAPSDNISLLTYKIYSTSILGSTWIVHLIYRPTGHRSQQRWAAAGESPNETD